uniref:DM domain-containing protein n=1 Tax=Heterorhabditis bacteriophora TaxID=37862 RepID=A0A1I7XLS6_HETBA
MNIEDILPELFGEKRVYYCQRCLNHGLREKRKNHKQLCSHRNCQCSDCIMVDRRRELNSRLVQIDGFSETSSDSIVTSESVHSNRDGSGGKIKERRPNCQRCAQHGVVNRLKGHKRSCPFKECFCPKCQVVVERQKLMADQIKLRRRQKREKNMRVERAQTPTNNSDSIPFRFEYISQKEQLRLYAMTNFGDSSMCLKCTQQAIGYQQLMSLLDPTAVSDPLLTLSAILQACPHREES